MRLGRGWSAGRGLTKYIVLSVVAHLSLLIYALSFRVLEPGDVGPGRSGRDEPGLKLQLAEPLPEPAPVTSPDLSRWFEPDAAAAAAGGGEPLPAWEAPWSLEPERLQLVSAELRPSGAGELAAQVATQLDQLAQQWSRQLSETESLPPADDPSQGAAVSDPPPLSQLSAAQSEVFEGSQSRLQAAVQLEPDSAEDPADQSLPRSVAAEAAAAAPPDRSAMAEVSLTLDAIGLNVSEPADRLIAAPVPDIPQRLDRRPIDPLYRGRWGEARVDAVQRRGGDARTEAAVAAALHWLAAAQSPDGSWEAARHGAGQERRTLGEYRHATGAGADTAMTGLALLAFLGAGHTHLSGPYREQVEAGLTYLVAPGVGVQLPSGDLSGPKQSGWTPANTYARLYSHAMATLAVAEAYAVTGDPRLREPLQRAAGYTLQAQNSRSGGWRYRPGISDDPGDTSQFGWHALALTTCQRGGLPVLTATHQQRMFGFLDSVRHGAHGGLASYRPRTVGGQQPTPAMTAEAWASRLLLGSPPSAAAAEEARQMLLAHLPGEGEDNFYYWYYGTLAMVRYQDSGWQRWNAALKERLLGSQNGGGSDDSGAWEPTCIWGGYGGRVYCTALGCLCLEAYYRFMTDL